MVNFLEYKNVLISTYFNILPEFMLIVPIWDKIWPVYKHLSFEKYTFIDILFYWYELKQVCVAADGPKGLRKPKKNTFMDT